MTDETPQLQALHKHYEALSGRQFPFNFRAINAWRVFVAQGYTMDDLKLMINHINDGIRKGTRNHGALKFSNMIENIDRVIEDISEARAVARNKIVETPRDKILAQSMRPKSVEHTARTAGDVMRGEQAFKELLKLRDNL